MGRARETGGIFSPRVGFPEAGRAGKSFTGSKAGGTFLWKPSIPSKISVSSMLWKLPPGTCRCFLTMPIRVANALLGNSFL